MQRAASIFLRLLVFLATLFPDATTASTPLTVTRTTDALGGVTVRDYDENDNESGTTTPLGYTTRRAFDAKNNLLHETDPLGNVSRYSYDAEKRPLSISDALNQATAITYSPIGNLTRMTDPAGTPTDFTYSNSGEIATLTDANGTITSYTHDSKGHEKSSKVTASNGTVLSSEVYDYDAAGNRSRSIATDGSRYFTTTHLYDLENRLTQTIYPDGTYSSTTYDPNGRVQSSSDSIGNTTNLYDLRGNLIQSTAPGSRITRSGYDVEGRMTSSTDTAGATTYTLYDALGRATATIQPDATMPATVLTDVAAIAAATQRMVTGFIGRHEARTPFRRREAEAAIAPGGADLCYQKLIDDLDQNQLAMVPESALLEHEFGRVMERYLSQSPPVFIRTNDVRHLAAARIASEIEFVSADAKQRIAADFLGFTVVPAVYPITES